MISDCTALIMAGGESRRMGRDKATLTLGDRSLLERVVVVMRQVFPALLVSVREARPDLEWPQVGDASPGAGPLAGLSAGLEKATTPWLFAVATDMPFMRPALIEYLGACRTDCQAVVPVVGGHPQPLAAFYAVSCRTPIRALLDGGGKRSLRGALEQLNVRYVDESELLAADPDLRSFFDLDTPDDLRAAERDGL